MIKPQLNQLINVLRNENASQAREIQSLKRRIASNGHTSVSIEDEDIISSLRIQLNSYQTEVKRLERECAKANSADVVKALELRNAIETEVELNREKEELEVIELATQEERLKHTTALRQTERKLEECKWEVKCQGKTLEGLREIIRQKDEIILKMERETSLADAEKEAALMVARGGRISEDFDSRLLLATAEVVAHKEEKQLLLSRFSALEEVIATKDREITNLRIRLGETEASKVTERREREGVIRQYQVELLEAKEQAQNAEREATKWFEESKETKFIAKKELDVINGKLRRDMNDLLGTVEERERKIEDLERECMENERRMELLRQELRDKDDKIKELNDDLADRRTDLDCLRNDDTVLLLRKELESMRGELSFAQKQLALKQVMEETLRNTQHENAQLRATLTEEAARARAAAAVAPASFPRSIPRSESTLASSVSPLSPLYKSLIKQYDARLSHEGQNMILQLPTSSANRFLTLRGPPSPSAMHVSEVFKLDEAKLAIILSNGQLYVDPKRSSSKFRSLLDSQGLTNLSAFIKAYAKLPSLKSSLRTPRPPQHAQSLPASPIYPKAVLTSPSIITHHVLPSAPPNFDAQDTSPMLASHQLGRILFSPLAQHHLPSAGPPPISRPPFRAAAT